MPKYQRKQLGKSLVSPRSPGRTAVRELARHYWRLTGRRGSLRFSELQLNTTLEELSIAFKVESVQVSVAIGHF